MGFAWKSDDTGEAFGDSYREDYRTGRRYYRNAVAWTGLRSPAGRHALSHSQRPFLPGFGVASRMPLGRSRGTVPGSQPALGEAGRDNRDDRERGGAGRGAHAARLVDVPRRTSRWPGPERWRRWA
jgi:hypothetical protein